MPSYPIDANDIIDAETARAICGTPSEATWQRWHKDDVIVWFVAPGTNSRRYSRSWFVQWIRDGARGKVSGHEDG